MNAHTEVWFNDIVYDEYDINLSLDILHIKNNCWWQCQFVLLFLLCWCLSLVGFPIPHQPALINNTFSVQHLHSVTISFLSSPVCWPRVVALSVGFLGQKLYTCLHCQHWHLSHLHHDFQTAAGDSTWRHDRWQSWKVTKSWNNVKVIIIQVTEETFGNHFWKSIQKPKNFAKHLIYVLQYFSLTVKSQQKMHKQGIQAIRIQVKFLGMYRKSWKIQITITPFFKTNSLKHVFFMLLVSIVTNACMEYLFIC